MFISRIPKYRQRPDGTIEKYDYYRLSENRRDADGKIRKRTVVNLGELPGYTKAGRKELGALLEEISQLHWPPLQCGLINIALSRFRYSFVPENDLICNSLPFIHLFSVPLHQKLNKQ